MESGFIIIMKEGELGEDAKMERVFARILIEREVVEYGKHFHYNYDRR